MGTSLVVAVTGANSGIGLRTVERLAAAGHRVYAICRSAERGAAAMARVNQRAVRPVELVVADLADPAAVAAAVDRLRGDLGRLDVLINNAAVFDQTMRQPTFTAAGHELFWATNHLGPFQLTAGLSSLLAAAPRPRVMFVASKGLVSMPWIKIRFDRLDDAGWYSPTKAYYHAKLAQVMISFQLALRAAGRLDVACIRVPAVRLDQDRVAAMPRLLRTLYGPKNRAAVPPEELAGTYARVAGRSGRWTDLADPSGDAAKRLRGIYLDEHERPVRAPRFAYDEAHRERLWDVTQRATGDPAWAW
jgi:NAD(P)-dependent dehydrogenase (short-subunit alcohol dehydrogenase family)